MLHSLVDSAGGACLGKLRKLRTFIFGNLRLNVYICELET